MEENKTWSFAVLEDCFGLVAAAQIMDDSLLATRLIRLKYWVSNHYEGAGEEGRSDGWCKLFSPDDDSELDTVPDLFGKPVKHGLTYRECRANLLAYLESNNLRCYITDDALGGDICDFYIQKNLRNVLERAIDDLQSESGTLRQEGMTLIQAPWYEFVRSHLLRRLISSPEDTITFGRYILTTPKFEELFNQIHAKYEAPAKAQSAPSSTQAQVKDGGKISRQQTYAMMMAPNGRCPKCNCPLKTRKSGLSTGKAAAGGILAGPIGAIVGASMGTTEYYCPACGYVR